MINLIIDRLLINIPEIRSRYPTESDEIVEKEGLDIWKQKKKTAVSGGQKKC